MKIKQLLLVVALISCFSGISQNYFRFNEFSFSNTGANPSDPLAAGQYNGSPDWIEIYNITTTTHTLTGWYISDDRTNLRKWQFPYVNNQIIKLDSHQVAVIYLCEHDKAVQNPGGVNAGSIQIDLHANFSINQTKPGSKLYITPVNSFQIMDSIDVYKYKTQPGHSWGRAQRITNLTGGHWITGSTWRLYQTATPGVINPDTTTANPTAWYYNYCPTPKVDLLPGFYSPLPTLNVTDTSTFKSYVDYANVEIYGTNDCTPPVFNNPNAQQIAAGGSTGTALTGQFNVPNNASAPVSIVQIQMRDATVPKRYLESFIFYGAYLEDSLRTGQKLSHTCVCVDTTLLFLSGAPKDSLPMIIDYFGTNSKEMFRNIGQGHVGKIDFYNPIGTGMNRRQWQFVFRSEDEYGYGYTNKATLFTDAKLGLSNRNNFPELIFRSAAAENFLKPGNTSTYGFKGAHVRDIFNHTMSLRHNLKFDAEHYVPTQLVINGWPRGIYYVKEPMDSLYTSYYYNHPRAAILANTNGTNQATISGTAVPNAQTLWNGFYSWAMQTNTNVHVPALYNRIADSLDFASFNDYMIYNMYSINVDYIKRYAMWWKGLPTDTTDHRREKWRFALTNTDYTWGYDLMNSLGIFTTPNTEPCDYLTPFGLSTPFTNNTSGNSTYPLMPLWFKLMDNDTFKSDFLTRYQDLLNTALSCDSLEDHLKYVRSVLTTNDMSSHVWWNLADPSGACATCDSVKFWKDQLDSIKVFMTERCSLVTEGIKNCFQIEGPYNLCVDVQPPNTGYVQLNSLTLKNFVWNGRYFDSVITTAKGIPYQNYVFDHWEAPKYTLSPSKTSDSVTFYVQTDACITAVFKLKPAYETYGTPMLPTGFSPNDDGNNDVLNVYGIADASSYELEVYNRWGERIFFSTNKSEGWDGKFNGTPVPAGVYAYRYNIVLNGKTYAAKGNVTLVR